MKTTCPKAKITKLCGVFLMMSGVWLLCPQNGSADSVTVASLEKASGVSEFDKIAMAILNSSGSVSASVEIITNKSGAISLAAREFGGWAIYYDDGSIDLYNSSGNFEETKSGLVGGMNFIDVMEENKYVLGKLTPSGVDEAIVYEDTVGVIPTLFIPGGIPAGTNVTDIAASFGSLFAVISGDSAGIPIIYELPEFDDADLDPVSITFAPSLGIDLIMNVDFDFNEEEGPVSVYIHYLDEDLDPIEQERIGHFNYTRGAATVVTTLVNSIPVDDVDDLKTGPIMGDPYADGRVYVLQGINNVYVYDQALNLQSTFDLSDGVLSGQLTVGPVVPELPQNGLAYLTFVLGLLIIALRRSTK